MGRESNTFKPAGSGHCGAVRTILSNMPVGGHTTITPELVGARDVLQILDGLCSARNNIAKREGWRFTIMRQGDGYYVKRLK